MSRYKVKNKRSKRKKTVVGRYSAMPERESHPASGGRAAALLLTGIVLIGVYVASWVLRETVYYRFSIGVTMVYYTALPLLLVVFTLLNRGLSNDVPTREQLSEDMSEEEKDAFIREVKECRRRARPWLIPIIPLALIVGFDILYGFLAS